jgi:hypothetical protein
MQNDLEISARNANSFGATSCCLGARTVVADLPSRHYPEKIKRIAASRQHSVVFYFDKIGPLLVFGGFGPKKGIDANFRVPHQPSCQVTMSRCPLRKFEVGGT